MRKLTPIEQALNTIEEEWREFANAKVVRARASDALDRHKLDYDKATDNEFACQSRLDSAREKLRVLIVQEDVDDPI